MDKETKIYDVIVVGAGPAGLFAALHIAKAGLKIALIEKNNEAGRKLLLSGQGQCNLTQDGDIADFITHYGDKERFVRSALYMFSNGDLREYFDERSVPSFVNEQGKVFPVSLKATEVRDVLLKECKDNGVHLCYSCAVESIDYNGDIFELNTEKFLFKANKLIVATGGKSFPKTGSSGDAYDWAKKLGHSIISPRPSLTAFSIDSYKFSNYAGISFKDVPVSLDKLNGKKHKLHGDLLLTHKGISGPVILHLSRYADAGDTLRVSFVSERNVELFKQKFMDICGRERQVTMRNVLQRYLAKRFADCLLDLAQIKLDAIISQLNKKQIKLVCEFLCEFPMEIKSVGDFSVAMATAGGISCKEINPKTMESKLCKNLYFIGEVLDVDGDTGGYNLQWAFSSAYLAAKSIEKDKLT